MVTTSILGRSGLSACRLGIACGYGAPTRAYEEAFDRGVNYFYFGGLRKRNLMVRAVKNLVGRGKRERLIIVLHSMARWAWLLERSLRKQLKMLGLEYAEVLLLAWHN